LTFWKISKILPFPEKISYFHLPSFLHHDAFMHHPMHVLDAPALAFVDYNCPPLIRKELREN